MQRQWAARPDFKSLVVQSLNLAFLPELFNRELYGRGWISWAKSSQVWRTLQQAQTRAAAQGAAGGDLLGIAIPMQVELLSGQVRAWSWSCHRQASTAMESSEPDWACASLYAVTTLSMPSLI